MTCKAEHWAFAGFVALLAWTCDAVAGGPEPAVWQRQWKLSAVTCPTCTPSGLATLRARQGTKVVLSLHSISNPFYQDCPSGADYTDIRPRAPREAATYLGQKVEHLRTSAPLAGLLRCAEGDGPSNVIGKIIIDGDHAYLADESGAILELR